MRLIGLLIIKKFGCLKVLQLQEKILYHSVNKRF